MAEVVLHHYGISPYSEKMRAIFGFKQLAWRSVTIPAVMPKPDVVALTGGYRKTPVMQIGCDVYCDTKLMTRVLDRIAPRPPLIPPGREASALVFEQWSERLFLLCVTVVFQPAGMKHLFGDKVESLLPLFSKDRAALFAGGTLKPGAASKAELPGALQALEAQLSASPFIDGAAATLGDFALYHCLWFILSNGGVARHLDAYPRIHEWAARIAAFGHGSEQYMTSEQALELARASRPLPTSGIVLETEEVAAGAAVTVAATDYGVDAVAGELVTADADEIVIRRRDARAGTVHVHFPRAGFRLTAAGEAA